MIKEDTRKRNTARRSDRVIALLERIRYACFIGHRVRMTRLQGIPARVRQSRRGDYPKNRRSDLVPRQSPRIIKFRWDLTSGLIKHRFLEGYPATPNVGNSPLAVSF